MPFYMKKPILLGLTACLIQCITGVAFSETALAEQSSTKAAQQPGAASTSNDDQDRPSHPFDRVWLEKAAKQLAQKPYQKDEINKENPLSELSYDDYRAIEFQNDAAIWANQKRPFRLGLLHPGFLYKTPVKINLVVSGVSRRVLYTTKIFNYGNDSNKVEGVSAPGYSGFRVNNPLNSNDKWDELAVFQGGSYFRALGKSNWYGLSARGLAVKTGHPKGEEFPTFTEFWIERPSTHATSLVVHALLDSPSVTGAFTYRITPGDKTIIDVTSTLYPRTTVKHYGVAPLTSMFLFDGINSRRFDDFRPAVHDSNSLLIIGKDNERVVRSLSNPLHLQVSSFSGQDIKGFGLMQRKREFSDYDDAEARYEKRPSVWVEPLADWGEGNVELFEIPSDSEANDNIVAYWQPKTPLEQGGEYVFNYRMFWAQSPFNYDGVGKVVHVRSGQTLSHKNRREFVVDYQGDAYPDDLVVEVSASNGRVYHARGSIVPATGRYRVNFQFEPENNNLSELRLMLKSDGKPWGETWLYRWTR